MPRGRPKKTTTVVEDGDPPQVDEPVAHRGEQIVEEAILDPVQADKDDEDIPHPDPVIEWPWVPVEIKNATCTATRDGPIYSHAIQAWSGGHGGPQNIPADCESKLDYFRLLFDDTILDTFILNSNSFILNSQNSMTSTSLVGRIISQYICYLPIRPSSSQ